MPIQYVPALKGYKYGKSGKIYTGKGAREKAKKQGQAIEISKLREEGKIKVKASKRARGYVREA